MKVLSKGRVYDFDKVVNLYYRESMFGNGYPIEIKIGRDAIFNEPIEIARVSTAQRAYQLVSAITENWAAQTPVFDIDTWLAQHPATSISI